MQGKKDWIRRRMQLKEKNISFPFTSADQFLIQFRSFAFIYISRNSLLSLISWIPNEKMSCLVLSRLASPASPKVTPLEEMQNRQFLFTDPTTNNETQSPSSSSRRNNNSNHTAVTRRRRRDEEQDGRLYLGERGARCRFLWYFTFPDHARRKFIANVII